MKKSILCFTIATILGGTAYAGQPQHEQPSQQPNIQGQSQLQGQLQGQTQGQEQGQSQSATSLSGASSSLLSETNQTTEAASKSISGAAAGSVSGSDSHDTVQGGESGADSQSNNDVTINQSSYRKYPEIPVNAGVTFASVCQEGSSGTNSKVSIALTTDSIMCNHLRLADTYYTMMQGYATSCKKNADDQVADWRHKTLIASQVKGSVKVDPLVVMPSETCKHADFMEEQMLHELQQAQAVNDKTHTTGIIAKWATQLGIPVTLLYVIGAVL